MKASEEMLRHLEALFHDSKLFHACFEPGTPEWDLWMSMSFDLYQVRKKLEELGRMGK